MTDQKNTILAIVLSALVLIGWQFYFGLPQVEKQKQIAQQQAQERSQPPAGAPDWQGYSVAQWEIPEAGRGGGGGANGPPALKEGETRGGSLKAVTTRMRPGYLRKNGVPYSGNAMLTEYYSRTKEPNGDSWLIVTTIVEDPQYLNQPFITSTHFKQQADASGWNPTPCSAR